MGDPTATIPTDPMTAEEFLEWAERQEGRYELHDGQIVPLHPAEAPLMQAQRRAHVRAKGALHVQCVIGIRERKLACEAMSDGMTVLAPNGDAYEPDLTIECGERKADGRSLTVDAPVVIAEVLSPSTATRDLGEKLRAYFTLPTVQHYLILDPEERLVTHHSRLEGGKLLTAFHRDGTIDLDPPGLTLEVERLWEP